MATTLSVIENGSPTVTEKQLELVRSTVAKNATTEQLELYLYDCERQGVHPLDRLLHCTIRGGKYVPITSIDLMRSRAAETGEYAGQDDAAITWDTSGDAPCPQSATVTVYRIVQGLRVAFVATARWAEYKPDNYAGLWDKMPTVMLSKCAEALALRKGFPTQLAGLYEQAELDQAIVAGDMDDTRIPDAPPKPIVQTVPPETAPDDPFGSLDGEVKGSVVPDIAMKAALDTPPTEATADVPKKTCITKPQQKRLYAIAKANNNDIDTLDGYLLETYGVNSFAEIERAHYEDICNLAEEGRFATQ
tara:strand:+ start:356 stop:1270 length:915 start_codon:yes stop_codon:yes gene_type:complete